MKTVSVRNITLGDGRAKIALPYITRKEDPSGDFVRSKADLLEFRADAVLKEAKADGTAEEEAERELFKELLKVREAVKPHPVLFTFRTRREGGVAEEEDGVYERLMTAVINGKKADLIDVEIDRERAEEMIRNAVEAGLPVVASCHSFTQTPSRKAILGRLLAMKAKGASLCKVAFMPQSRKDVENVLTASAIAKESLGVPFLAISMGEMGQATRTACEQFGSAFTFGCLPDEASAPGQMDTLALRAQIDRFRQEGSGQNIFLTGFMGTGKSTVSRVLAERTGLPAVEMDELIEKEEGRRVADIFLEEGEEHFRDMETSLLLTLYRGGRQIVSCGGGLVLRPENVAVMHALGRVVHLTASPETILKRLSHEAANRPKLRNRMSVEGISDLYEERRTSYERAANFTVRTDGREVEDIVREIISLCGIESGQAGIKNGAK
jgi:3-dehydroquinate dehydratase type I